MDETERIRKSTGPDRQLDFYQLFINTSVHVHGRPSSSLRIMAVLSSCRRFSALARLYYLAHLTKTATLRRLPQFGSDTSPKRGGITMTISPSISPISFRFQVFFAKILALLSAVSDLKNILEICQKMRNIQEICSRKWFRNRKSKVADRIFENSSGPFFRTDILYRNYSLGAPVPVLYGCPTKFLQKIEWKKVACRCMVILRNRNFISYFA